MSEIGSHPGAWTGFNFSGLNTQNQLGMAFTMPETGDITSISCFFGGDGSAVNAKLCVWDGSGTLLASTAQFSAASGSRSAGGQAWQTQSLGSALRVTSGATIYVGFWRDPAGSSVWSTASSGTWYDRNCTGGSVCAMTGLTSHGSASIGAYATYTPVAATQQVYVDTVQLTTGTYVDGGQVADYLDTVEL